MDIIFLKTLNEKNVRFSEDEILQLKKMLELQESNFYAADEQLFDSLIKIFAKAYWDSDTRLEQSSLLIFLQKLPFEQKQKIIGKLINNCMFLQAYVVFAQTLMTSLPAPLQKEIQIYPNKVSKDGIGTQISQAEFDYRNRNGLKCHIDNGKYYRPMTYQDIDNYYIMLQMVMTSERETFFYID